LRGETRELERLRRADGDEVDLSEATFPTLHAEDMELPDWDDAPAPAPAAEDSDVDEIEDPDALDHQAAVNAATRVANVASSRGAGLDGTLDALERAEAQAQASKPQRSGIARLLLSGRPASNAASKPAPAPLPRDVDEAARSDARTKLAAVMGGNMEQASAAEARAFDACRGLPSRYKQLVQDAVLAAQRGAAAHGRPANGTGQPPPPSGTGSGAAVRRPATFVPPRPAAKRVQLVPCDDDL
jgi:hypothetical protein